MLGSPIENLLAGVTAAASSYGTQFGWLCTRSFREFRALFFTLAAYNPMRLKRLCFFRHWDCIRFILSGHAQMYWFEGCLNSLC